MIINLKLQSDTLKKIYPLIEKWLFTSVSWQREFAKEVERAIKEVNKIELEKKQKDIINPMFSEITKYK